MKDTFLAAALCAVASLNSFGAPCVNGTLADLTAGLSGGGSCTVGAAGQWSLSTFGLFDMGGGGFNALVTASDIFVSFTSVTSVGGGPGFTVSFSDAPRGNNFFTASAGMSQSQNWRSMFVIESGPALQSINSSLQNPNVTNPQPDVSNGSVSLNTAVFSGNNMFINDVTLLALPGLRSPAC